MNLTDALIVYLVNFLRIFVELYFLRILKSTPPHQTNEFYYSHFVIFQFFCVASTFYFLLAILTFNQHPTCDPVFD